MTVPPSPPTLTLPGGLVGLPDVTQLTRLETPESAIVELLAVDEPELGFFAARLEVVRPALRDRLLELGHARPEDEVLVLLAVHGMPPRVTANLAGPIVIDPDGIGRQLVLEGDEFPLREPVAVAG